MNKAVKELQGKVLGQFVQASLRELKLVRIRKGGTEKSRQVSHIFVPGEIYGGKLGMLLCRKPYKEFLLAPGIEHISDMCPQCRKKIEAICREVMGLPGRSVELFLAPGSKVAYLTKEEIFAGMQVVRQKADASKKKAAPEQLTVVDMTEVKHPVRKTEPWNLPSSQP